MNFTIQKNLVILALLCACVRGISVTIGTEGGAHAPGKSVYLSACDETVIYTCGPNSSFGATEICSSIYDEASGGTYPSGYETGIGRVVAARPLCAMTNFPNQLIVSSAGGVDPDRLQVDSIDFDTFAYEYFCPSMTNCDLDYAVDTGRTCTTLFGDTETLWNDFFLEIDPRANTAGTYIFGNSGVTGEAYILQAQDQPNPSVVCSCFGGFYVDANDPDAPQCTECGNTCDLCDANGCTTCPNTNETIIDGVCVPCESSCATCDSDGCTTCPNANETIIDDVCVPCDSSCATCDSNGCTTCPNANEVVINGVCCNDSCGTCDANGCTTCPNANEVVINGVCCNDSCGTCDSNGCTTCPNTNETIINDVCVPCDSSCATCDANGCTTCPNANETIINDVCVPCDTSCATCDSNGCTTCPNSSESIIDSECKELWYEPTDQIWSIYHPGCVRWNSGLFVSGETGTFTLQSGGTEVLMREDILLSTGGFDFEKIYGILPSELARVKGDFGTRDPIYSSYFEVTVPIMGHDHPCVSL